jgi:hypothetical protein
MASKNIEDSQEQRHGISIGQSNEDKKVPNGTGGSHRPKKHPVDLHIPNQDQSSATNQQKAQDNSAQNE